MAGNHPTTSDTARSTVLREALSALNAADNHGKRLHHTSVAEYRAAVLKAMTPIATQPVDEPLSAAPAGHEGNVIDMWAGVQRRA